MKCKCGYEAASVEKAEARLPDSHTLSDHTYYIWGTTDKTIELLESYHLIPKDSQPGRMISNATPNQ